MNGETKTHEGLSPALLAEGDWHISEFTSDNAGLVVRGRFHLSPFERLSSDQAAFLLTFLRCRGVISSVEKELGISYPTVRSRLDALLAALGLAPAADVGPNNKRAVTERHKEILAKLEAGEMTPEDAKTAMKEASK